MFELENSEIVIRLFLAVLFGSMIGYEREIKGHDAGLRTHILVCVGACIITLVQLKATYITIDLVIANPDLDNILNTDMTRMTAQIVSGIGFLGAGTIIVNKRSVTGLTTAASIWAVAGLGIATGMGDYFLSLISSFVILLVLRVIKKLFRVQSTRKLEIYYINREETTHFLKEYFREKSIHVLAMDYTLHSSDEDKRTYVNLYTLSLPDKVELSSVVEELSTFNTITRIYTPKES